MSHIVTKLVWRADIRPAPRKLVLVFLADLCDDSGGKLWPSVQTVANACCMSRAQAQRHMRALQHEELLEVVEKATGRPGKTPNYRINLVGLTGRMDAKEGSYGCTGGVAPMHKTGSMDAQEGPHGCDPIHQRTTIDPPTNQATVGFDSDLESKTSEVIRLARAAGIELPARSLGALSELIGKGATAEQWSYAISEAKRAAATSPGGYLVKVMRTQLEQVGGATNTKNANRFGTPPPVKMSRTDADEWADHLGINRYDGCEQMPVYLARLRKKYDEVQASQDCAVA